MHTDSEGQVPQRPEPPPRSRRLAWLLPLVVVLAVLIARPWQTPAATEVPYSTFLTYLDSGIVTHVDVTDRLLRARLRPAGTTPRRDVVTIRVEPGLGDLLRARGVAFGGHLQSGWTETLLSWLLPTLVFFAVWMYLMRRVQTQQGTGVLGFGRSGAKVYAERGIAVTFSDVAGVDEAKAELREIVAFLKDPVRFGRLGARIPKGILLVGPPGTGKTLLARAVAGEAGVPFLSINGSEFVELFVGIGAARVRDLFKQARQCAPCIVFIDEIDALGRARSGGVMGGANDEKEQTLNQLLAEMDGFTPDSRVILLSATNRPETLDPALLRAGRFDRQVLVDRPDRGGRGQILAVHVKRIPLDPALQLDEIAGLTPGFTGADLANLVNEAALTATRRGSDHVALEDFTVAVERLVAGLEKKSRILSVRERGITSVHEMGHALIALALPGVDPVHKVSIIPHGLGALGFTLQRPTEDRYIATRRELEDKMTVLLGGRAAELVTFGELSTGAADDLVKATELARDMVMRLGMDATVGHVVYGAAAAPFLGPTGLIAPESRMYSEATARDIELAVRELVAHALEQAVAILHANRSALDDGATRLRERESLMRDELPVVTWPAPAPSGNAAAPAPAAA
ncbi:MAG: ATP-dependent zinc metalloprotease FtsH [Gemmatimonadaceae bacterium]